MDISDLTRLIAIDADLASDAGLSYATAAAKHEVSHKTIQRLVAIIEATGREIVLKRNHVAGMPGEEKKMVFTEDELNGVSAFYASSFYDLSDIARYRAIFRSVIEKLIAINNEILGVVTQDALAARYVGDRTSPDEWAVANDGAEERVRLFAAVKKGCGGYDSYAMVRYVALAGQRMPAALTE